MVVVIVLFCEPFRGNDIGAGAASTACAALVDSLVSAPPAIRSDRSWQWSCARSPIGPGTPFDTGDGGVSM